MMENAAPDGTQRERMYRVTAIARLAVVATLLFASTVASSNVDAATHMKPLPIDVPLSLIPKPSTLEPKPGVFRLRNGAALIVDSRNAEAASIAKSFADRLAATRGIRLDVRPFGNGASDDAIVFSLDPRTALVPSGEGYDLAVDARGIVLRARDPRGLFYGSITLWQLLTQDVDTVTNLDVPQLHIVDAPRFAWRGVMLDSARHFQPPEFVKRFIDEIATLKLNTFHWHLTDDQGWRIEIKRHPKLTEIGAWRQDAGAAGVDANGKPVRYGGFYTQDEIRDIVRYAAARYVTIVPEIDMPGHMQAAIAAYPELGSLGDAPAVSHDWGVHTYLLNVDDATLAFVDDVLDEVVDLFPGPYIHIGGDEAAKDQWKASPRVQARMKALGLKDENALQGWFVAEVEKHLEKRGKRAVGWDEILEGGVPKNAIIMSWRGAKGGVEAARAGHDVVMAPSPDLYLDHLQGSGIDEPPGRPDVRTLADVYAFDPIPAGMSADAAKYVLGAQAALWTEHMRTPERVDHAAFPRLDALAEVLWSPATSRDFADFAQRLVAEMDRHRASGIHPSDAAFDVTFDAHDAGEGSVKIALASQSGLVIHYTTDGGDPGYASPQYANPLALRMPATLRAATFLDHRRASKPRTFEWSADDAFRRAGHALTQCTGNLTLRLEDDAPRDGDRAIFDVDLFHPCWLWKGAPLDGTQGIAVRVGQVPYNFQLAGDIAHVVPRPKPTHPGGELLVHVDGCEGALLATLPLDEARANPALTTLAASWKAPAGARDLCFEFAGEGNDPLWTIDDVTLVRAAR
jgi:hexosaminidase